MPRPSSFRPRGGAFATYAPRRPDTRQQFQETLADAAERQASRQQTEDRERESIDRQLDSEQRQMERMAVSQQKARESADKKAATETAKVQKAEAKQADRVNRAEEDTTVDVAKAGVDAAKAAMADVEKRKSLIKRNFIAAAKKTTAELKKAEENYGDVESAKIAHADAMAKVASLPDDLDWEVGKSENDAKIRAEEARIKSAERAIDLQRDTGVTNRPKPLQTGPQPVSPAVDPDTSNEIVRDQHGMRKNLPPAPRTLADVRRGEEGGAASAAPVAPAQDIVTPDTTGDIRTNFTHIKPPKPDAPQAEWDAYLQGKEYDPVQDFQTRAQEFSAKAEAHNVRIQAINAPADKIRADLEAQIGQPAILPQPDGTNILNPALEPEDRQKLNAAIIEAERQAGELVEAQNALQQEQAALQNEEKQLQARQQQEYAAMDAATDKLGEQPGMKPFTDRVKAMDADFRKIVAKIPDEAGRQKAFEDYQARRQAAMQEGAANREQITKAAADLWNARKTQQGTIPGRLDVVGQNWLKEQEAAFGERLGLTPKQTEAVITDYGKLNDEWEDGLSGAEQSRALSDGRVIVNPTLWVDSNAYEKAVKASEGSEEGKKQALAILPQLKAEAATRLLNAVAKSPELAQMVNELPGKTDEERVDALLKSRRDHPMLRATASRLKGGADALAGSVMGLISLVTGNEWATESMMAWNEEAGANEALAGASGLSDGTKWGAFKNFMTKVPAGAQSVIPALAGGGGAGLVARVLGAGQKTAQAAQIAGSAVAAGLQSTGGTYGEAFDSFLQGRDYDAARSQAIKPALISGLITAAATYAGGARGVESIFREPAGRAVAKQALKDALRAGGISILKEGSEEFLEEALDQLGQAVLAKYTYQPDKPLSSIITEVLEAGALGAVLGGGMGAAKAYDDYRTQDGKDIAKGADLAASDEELRTVGEVDPLASTRAMILRDIAQGTDITTLQNDQLAAVGLQRTDKGEIKPAKGKDALPPAIAVENGKPIILQPELDALEQQLPATRALVGMSEKEARAKATAQQAKPPEPAKPKISRAGVISEGHRHADKIEARITELERPSLPSKIPDGKGGFTEQPAERILSTKEKQEIKALQDELQRLRGNLDTDNAEAIAQDYGLEIGAPGSGAAPAESVAQGTSSIASGVVVPPVPPTSAQGGKTGTKGVGAWTARTDKGTILTIPAESAKTAAEAELALASQVPTGEVIDPASIEAPQAAPAKPTGAKSTTVRDQIMDAAKPIVKGEKDVKKAGGLATRAKMLAEAVEREAGKFNGIVFEPVPDSSGFSIRSDGSLAVDVELALRHLEGKSMADVRRFITRVIKEEFQHRISIELERDNKEWADKLQAWYDSLPDDIKQQAAATYNAQNGGKKFRNDFEARHETFRQFLERKNLTEAALAPKARKDLRDLILAFVKALRAYYRTAAPQVRALLDELIQQAEAKAAELQGLETKDASIIPPTKTGQGKTEPKAPDKPQGVKPPKPSERDPEISRQAALAYLRWLAGRKGEPLSADEVLGGIHENHTFSVGDPKKKGLVVVDMLHEFPLSGLLKEIAAETAPAPTVDAAANEAETDITESDDDTLPGNAPGGGVSDVLPLQLETREVAALKRLVNRGVSHAEVVRNSVEGRSLLAKLDRLIKRPLEPSEPVDLSMLPLGHDLKIIKGVVQSIPVSVVDNLLGGELSAKRLLHNKTVFELLSSDSVLSDADKAIGRAIPTKLADVSASGGPADALTHTPNIARDSAKVKKANATADKLEALAAKTSDPKLAERYRRKAAALRAGQGQDLATKDAPEAAITKTEPTSPESVITSSAEKPKLALPEPSLADIRDRNKIVGHHYAGPPGHVVIQLRGLDTEPLNTDLIAFPWTGDIAIDGAKAAKLLKKIFAEFPNASMRETVIRIIQDDGTAYMRGEYRPSSFGRATYADVFFENIKATKATPSTTGAPRLPASEAPAASGQPAAPPPVAAPVSPETKGASAYKKLAAWLNAQTKAGKAIGRYVNAIENVGKMRADPSIENDLRAALREAGVEEVPLSFDADFEDFWQDFQNASRAKPRTSENVPPAKPRTYGQNYVEKHGVKGAMERITHLRKRMEEERGKKDQRAVERLAQESDNIGNAILEVAPTWDWASNEIPSGKPEPKGKNAPPERRRSIFLGKQGRRDVEFDSLTDVAAFAYVGSVKKIGNHKSSDSDRKNALANAKSHMETLKRAFPGLTEAQLRVAANDYSDTVIEQARGVEEDEKFTAPKFSPTPEAKPEPQAAPPSGESSEWQEGDEVVYLVARIKDGVTVAREKSGIIESVNGQFARVNVNDGSTDRVHFSNLRRPGTPAPMVDKPAAAPQQAPLDAKRVKELRDKLAQARRWAEKDVGAGIAQAIDDYERGTWTLQDTPPPDETDKALDAMIAKERGAWRVRNMEALGKQRTAMVRKIMDDPHAVAVITNPQNQDFAIRQNLKAKVASILVDELHAKKGDADLSEFAKVYDYFIEHSKNDAWLDSVIKEIRKEAPPAEAPKPAPPKAPAPAPKVSAEEAATDDKLRDALSDLFSPSTGLSSPAVPDQRGIPRDKSAKFFEIAGELIDQGVNTPRALADRLERIFQGKARPFSQAIWNFIGTVDPSLSGQHDWNALYNEQSEKPAEPAPVDKKQAEEAVELQVVKDARDIVARGESPGETFDALVKLYEDMPALTAKTSTSKINQAYSTPPPIAYVGSRLADIVNGTVVAEYTAGNGMLLMESKPTQIVLANELDPKRRARLESLDAGFIVSDKDATTWLPPQKPDRVYINPPFGTVMGENGLPKLFDTPFGKTTSIDHAIVMQSLATMNIDGRAVFIIGGPPPLARTDKARAKSYSGGSRGEFFRHLYENWKVSGHFTINGDLYAKQGAGWPIDVIVVDGAGKSPMGLPTGKPPPMLNTWAELKSELSKSDEDRIAASRFSEAELITKVDELGDALGGLSRPSGGTVPSNRPDAPPRTPATGSGTGTQQPGMDQGPGSTGGVSTPSVRPPAVEGLSEHGGTVADGATVSPANSVLNADESGNTLQVPYQPASGVNPGGFLAPLNLSGPMMDALGRLKERVGDLVPFVHKKLKYGKDEDITQYFFGDQIDAIALAIDNFENGGALVVGDMTGTGKGRIAAALMRYAVNEGKTPIFVTKNQELYMAMLGDLADINSAHIVPVITDNNIAPEIAKTNDKITSGKKVFEEVAKTGELPEGTNAIFTTYYQIKGDDRPGLTKGERARAKSQKQAPPGFWRMAALERMAPNSVLILDESHLASGKSTTAYRFASLLRATRLAYYSSATFAKRPESVGIYFKTRLGQMSGGNLNELIKIMEDGGVPAMQVASSMLAQDGQYLRRESDFSGCKFDTTINFANEARDKTLADTYTTGLREIVFVQSRMAAAAKAINDILASQARTYRVPAAGAPRLESSNFSAKMHNLISQYLLAIKVEGVVAKAIDAIQNGHVNAKGVKTNRKVIVAVQSTMESVIEDLAGSKFPTTFKGALLNYLDGQRVFRTGRGENDSFYVSDDPDRELADLNDEQLRARAIVVGTNPLGERVATIVEPVVKEMLRRVMIEIFHEAEANIKTLDLGNMPLSPIDALRQGVERAGIQTGEITGRKVGLTSAGETYERTAKERKGRLAVMAAFNEGDVDFLVINQSGSTGISLHDSKKWKKSVPRFMILAQPNLDINEFMQILGRPKRSGQLTKPDYVNFQTTLPAEKRPAAILGRKMAMLNANTTSNAKSDVGKDEGNDIFNQYGDEVVHTHMVRHPELVRQIALSWPKLVDGGALKPLGDFAEEDPGYFARSVTGHLAILPVEEQEAFWEHVESEYKALISYLDAIGENKLRAATMDIRAKTINRQMLGSGAETGDSVFSQPAYVETVEAKLGKEPIRADEAMQMSRDLSPTSQPRQQAFIAQSDEFIAREEERKARVTLKGWDEKRDSWLSGQREQRDRIASVIGQIGQIGTYEREDGKLGYAVITDVKLDDEKPTTPSKQIVVVHVNDSRHTMRIYLSQFAEFFTPVTYGERAGWERTWDFSNIRHIITGNLLKGLKDYPGRGRIISYTTDAGEGRMGILMPTGFTNDQQAAEQNRVPVTSADQLREVLHGRQPVFNPELTVRFRESTEGVITLEVPAARSTGGKYWRDPELNRLMERGEFVESGGWMRGTIPPRNLPQVFERLVGMGETFKANPPRQSGSLSSPSAGFITPAMDEAYLDAVRRGYMDSARAMVEQAAKGNGYKVEAWHGKRGEWNFEVFDTSKEGGVHFGNKDQAEMRGGKGNARRFFLKMVETARVRDKGAFKRIPVGKDSAVYLNRYEGISLDTVTTIPGEVLDRMTDAEFRKAVPESEDSYMVRHAWQIKSAETVTRDAQGNVIPLSARFNPESPSILYSPSVGGDRDAEYLAAVERGDMETAQRMVDEAAEVYESSKAPKTIMVGSDAVPISQETVIAYIRHERSDKRSPANPFLSRQEQGKVGGLKAALTRALKKDGLTFTQVAPILVNLESSDRRAVTRDAQGNVIPLSQRFNPASNSTLYSAAPGDESDAGAIEAMMRELSSDLPSDEDMANLREFHDGELPGEFTIGDPEIANPGATEPQRKFMDVAREIYSTNLQTKQQFADWDREGREMATRDPEGVKRAVMDAYNEGRGLSQVETRAAVHLNRDMMSSALTSGNEKQLRDATAFAVAYYGTGTEVARAMRARADTTKTKEERLAEFLTEAITNPQKIEDRVKLESLPRAADKARTIARLTREIEEAKAEKDSATVQQKAREREAERRKQTREDMALQIAKQQRDEIAKALKKEGLSIEDLLDGRVQYRLKFGRLVMDAMGRKDPQREKAIDLLVHGWATRDIAKATKMTEADVAALREELRARPPALREALAKAIQRGMDITQIAGNVLSSPSQQPTERVLSEPNSVSDWGQEVEVSKGTWKGEFGTLRFIERDSSGKIIGALLVGPSKPGGKAQHGKWKVFLMATHIEHRRQGVMSRLWTKAQNQLGQLQGADEYSDDAKSFLKGSRLSSPAAGMSWQEALAEADRVLDKLIPTAREADNARWRKVRRVRPGDQSADAALQRVIGSLENPVARPRSSTAIRDLIRLHRRKDGIRDFVKKATGLGADPKLAEEAHELIEAERKRKVRPVVDVDLDVEYLPFDHFDPKTTYRVMRRVDSVTKPWFDMIREYWINSILSGLQTQVVNLVGNAAVSLYELIVERAFESAIGSLGGRKANVQSFGEYRHLLKGILPGIVEGAQMAAAAWSTEQETFGKKYLTEDEDDGDIDRHGPTGSIPGKVGRVVRIPGRSLRAADNFFKTVIARIEVGAMAYRVGRSKGLKKNALSDFINSEVGRPGSLSWVAAAREAERRTFTDNNALVNVTEHVLRLKGVRGFFEGKALAAAKKGDMNMARAHVGASKIAGFTAAVLSLIFPFVRTPVNIFRMGLKKSPVGSLSLIYNIASGLNAAARGEGFVSKYPAAVLTKNLTEQALAWTAFTLLYAMAEGDDDDDKKKWLLVGGRPYSQETGTGDADSAKRQYGGTYMLVRRNESGVIDMRVPFGRVEPFATALGGMIDAMSMMKRHWRNRKEGESGKAASAVAQGVARNLLGQAEDKTFLRGFSNVMRAVGDIRTDGGRGEATKFLTDIAAGFVPNLGKQAVRNLDDYERNYKQSEWSHSFWPDGKAANQMVDIFGEDVTKSGPKWLRVLWPTPLNIPHEKNTTDELLQSWNVRHPVNVKGDENARESRYFPERPDRGTYQIKTGPGKNDKRTMTLPEMRAFDKTAGQRFRTSQQYLTPPAASRGEFSDIARLRRNLSDSRAAAKAQVSRPAASAAVPTRSPLRETLARLRANQ